MTETIAELKFKLMQANTLIESRDEEIKLLAERIEYANAGDLVTIPRELVLAMEAKMKAQAETIARLTAELAQCKHALDDEGWNGDMCKCGHSVYDHTRRVGCLEPSEDDSGLSFCACSKFEAAK